MQSVSARYPANPNLTSLAAEDLFLVGLLSSSRIRLPRWLPRVYAPTKEKFRLRGCAYDCKPYKAEAVIFDENAEAFFNASILMNVWRNQRARGNVCGKRVRSNNERQTTREMERTQWRGYVTASDGSFINGSVWADWLCNCRVGLCFIDRARTDRFFWKFYLFYSRRLPRDFPNFADKRSLSQSVA